MAPQPISVNQVAKATPSRYVFAGGEEVSLEAAYAEFDGAGAGSTWLPSLAVYAPNGVLLGRGFPAAAVIAGGTAKVTFAPFSVGGDSAVPAGSGLFQLKVVRDPDELVVGDNQLIMLIDETLDNTVLTTVAGYITFPSAFGPCSVTVANNTTAQDMLSTPITIDTNETTSYSAAVPPVVNGATATVHTGDLIAINIDVAGFQSRGLGVVLGFV